MRRESESSAFLTPETMPELPEVETIVTTLAPKLVDRRIESVVHIRNDIVTPPACDLLGCLCGRTISSLHRRAKRIIVILDDGNAFYIHLGMTGRLTVETPDEPRAPHTHLVLQMDNVRQLRFRDPRRFGGIFWLGKGAIDDGIGPEPLTTRWTELRRRLNRTTRAIKNALMDQRLIAGLGNIYVDESLFRAGLHPLRRADRLSDDEIKTVMRAIKAVLRKAIRHRGSTLRDYVDANGTPGMFQSMHDVYDRKGLPCRRCGTPIKRLIVGGRSTHFCPICQPRRHKKSGRTR